MKLYAQQGYGKGDKIHTGLDSDFLDGVILSPRDEKEEKMKSFIKEINDNYPNEELYFDPQFYYSLYLDGTSKNLDGYNYFPGVLKLSDLRSFRSINQHALKCIEYQESIGLKKIVSPSILIPNFSDRQAQIALNLAEESANIAASKGLDIMISLVFSESSLNESRNVNDFLNELTTLDSEGFYVTIDRKTSDYSQDFESDSTLLNLLTFIYSLSEINEYKVIMGYSDIIGLLYTAVGASGFSTGWHNSSRKFTVQQRILPSKGGRQPRERYTSIPLLNSVLVSELDTIAQQFKNRGLDIKNILSSSNYENVILAGPSPSDSWSRGLSHLQHWSAIKNATKDIFKNPDDISDRLDDLEDHINKAVSNYKLLETLPLQLERSSKGNHLETWSKALKDFRRLHHV
ncbi:hypothetical protein [Heyndrickxia oleronia]|uniref:Uncharacterized protein n=1 Tax=Heyndrickxia oleronia TaxID=38875 RepID=A0AAW6SUW0_9BACI|nr:hypothetical protein [Heyndrickxia oleronia]MDH5160606.1 hypothetical protein [Heyndrickxia oleronia]